MLVELCIILRITLNDAGNYYTLKHANIAPCSATKEPQTEVVLRNTSKVPAPREITSDKTSKQRWVQGLPLANSPKNDQPNAQRIHPSDKNAAVFSKLPHPVTKLAKSLHYGFDPYFSKGYFEPFETRPRPITLVAFRKNGLAPRKTTTDRDIGRKSEIAELQSPFNPVSNFGTDVDDNLPYNNLQLQ